MKSEQIEEVFRYFNEPYEINGEWAMLSRFTPFKNIKCKTYAGCFDEAYKTIKTYFKKEK